MFHSDLVDVFILVNMHQTRCMYARYAAVYMYYIHVKRRPAGAALRDGHRFFHAERALSGVIACESVAVLQHCSILQISGPPFCVYIHTASLSVCRFITCCVLFFSSHFFWRLPAAPSGVPTYLREYQSVHISICRILHISGSVVLCNNFTQQ